MIGRHRIIVADALQGLQRLDDDSVDAVVTSPPFWQLRDYGVDGQLGLEPTPDEYVARLVGIFAEVRRVLRPDDAALIEIGDTYGGGTIGRRDTGDATSRLKAGKMGTKTGTPNIQPAKQGKRPPGIKPKDLVGIPFRLVLALQADGWYWRQTVIWHKPDCMPENVKDRPTTAHSYVFQMTKAPKYRWSLRDDAQGAGGGAIGRVSREAEAHQAGNQARRYDRPDYSVLGRNARSVWTISPGSFPQAHFAVMPMDLALRCIEATAGTDASRVVLDPLMGAGTTLIAAVLMGHDAIGIELSADYALMADDRIKRETRPGTYRSDQAAPAPLFDGIQEPIT